MKPYFEKRQQDLKAELAGIEQQVVLCNHSLQALMERRNLLRGALAEVDDALKVVPTESE